MKKKLLTALVILLCLAAPFLLVDRVIGETESHAWPIVPLEVLSLLIGLSLDRAGWLRRELHPLTLLPCCALLLPAALTLRVPMDYMAYLSSGYIEGSKEGLGALRMTPGHNPLYYLFARDDHVTLYGLVSQLLLGLTGGALLSSLTRWNARRFAWRPCLLLLVLACGALLGDGLLSWAHTRLFADNWFGSTMNTGFLHRYNQLNLTATLITPLLALGLGMLCGRMPVKRWVRSTLSAACIALFLLGSGLLIVPGYISPFDSSRYIPYLTALFPATVASALSTHWIPLLFCFVAPYRVLPPLLMGLIWAPAQRK